MVVGSIPPEPCGVGDYTHRLVHELQRGGIDARLVHDGDWRVRSTSRFARKLREGRFDVTHIQYPSVGYGYKLGPHLLACRGRPAVVTVHEVSRTHPLRRLSLYAFWVCARRVVFTTEYERRYALRMAPWLRARSTVIPVGSFVAAQSAPQRDLADIVYFGLIRTNKGLEQVLELARQIRRRDLPYRVRIVGTPDRNHLDYADELRREAEGLPIVWETGLSADAVAGLLARTRIGYAPFPDGASERRSSLIAMLVHGVATITTGGPQTPPEMEAAVLIADGPEAALEQIVRLMEDPVLLRAYHDKAYAYSERFSWESITAQHIDLYESMRIRRRRLG